MQISKTITFPETRLSHADGHQRFAAARQEMLRAWRIWLEMQPDFSDVEEELQGSIGSLRGLAATIGAQQAGSAR